MTASDRRKVTTNAPALPESDLNEYTIIPAKLRYYENEAERYLMRGSSAAAQAFTHSLTNALDQLALLLIKPDTVARRQIELCLAILEENAFKVVLAQPLALTAGTVRSLYRFQFNAITEGGKALSDMVYTKGPSLLLVLENTLPLEGRSASRRLAALKGAEPDKGPSPNSLRGTIGALSKVFHGIHCSDESLDVLRETAVLLEDTALLDLFMKVAATVDGRDRGDLSAVIQEVYRKTPEHDLDLDRSTMRVLKSLRQIAETSQNAPIAHDLLTAFEHTVDTGGDLDWASFAAGLATIGMDPFDWDVLLAASRYVEYEVPGASMLIGNFSSLA